jgi:hypothetical protein
MQHGFCARLIRLEFVVVRAGVIGTLEVTACPCVPLMNKASSSYDNKEF